MRRSWLAGVTLASLAATAAGVAACADLGGLSNDAQADAAVDAAGADAADVDAGGDSATPDAGGPRCKGEKGPTPVMLDGYCIDATEVSNRQFAEFMAATGGDGGALPAQCSGVSIPPEPAFWPKSDDNPVRSISWCGARAYCAWAGKRLCGHAGGGVLTAADKTNPFSNEWYAACSAKGTRAFPYGNAYDPEACRGQDHSSTGTGDVGSLATCEGPAGVFDLSGNVWEWIDQCAAGDGGSPLCTLRGGSYASGGAPSCGITIEAAIDPTGSDMGIRCCSDLE